MTRPSALRAARNVDGRVILYADKITDSIKYAMAETERRRTKQVAYNTEHGITPKTIVKAVENPLAAIMEADYVQVPKDDDELVKIPQMTIEQIPGSIKRLRAEMKQAAAKLEFERAAELRDRVRELEQLALKLGGELPA